MGGVGRRTTPYSGSSVKFVGLVEADAVTFLAQQGGEGAVMSVFVCPTCHSNPPTQSPTTMARTSVLWHLDNGGWWVRVAGGMVSMAHKRTGLV